MSYAVRIMEVLIGSDGKRSREYDYVDAFSDDDIAPVFLYEEGWGYIDIYLNEICKLKYEEASGFIDGLGCVKLDGKYGFVNKDGEEICEIKYDKVWAFSSKGIALVEVDGKYGFINKNGEEICEVKYNILGYKGGSIIDRFEEFHDFRGFNFKGLAVIVENGKAGLINENGQIILEPMYDEIILPRNSYMEDGEHIPYKKNGKMGYLDCNGNVIMLADYYDNVGIFYNGFACVKLGDKCGYIDSSFKKLCDLKYSLVLAFVHYSYAVAKKTIHVGPFKFAVDGYVDRTGHFSLREPYS